MKSERAYQAFLYTDQYKGFSQNKYWLSNLSNLILDFQSKSPVAKFYNKLRTREILHDRDTTSASNLD